MLTDAASIGLLIKAFSYGMPAAFFVLTLLLVKIQVKYQREKTNQDRKEHMIKWDTMLQVQKDAVLAQKESTLAVVQSHREEINRMFQAQERQSQTLESLAHNLSVITSKIEHRDICPIERKS